MNPSDRIAFGNRVTEIAKEEGVKFAQSILSKIAVMAVDYVANRSPWMPPDAEIDPFVGILTSKAAPFVQKTLLQSRFLSMEERRMAANYSNILPINQTEFYLASAERRLRAEGGNCFNPEAFLDLFLFLCNKRRIHDDN